MRLRPYQQEGKTDIFDAWTIDDIIMYICATGGGKTVTFVEVIREFLLRGMRTMLIAHRDELIQQAFDTLYQERIYSGIIQGNTKTDYDLPSQVCSIGTIVRRKELPHADLIVIDEGHHVTDDNSYAKILKRYPNAKVLIVTATPYRLSGDGFECIVKEKKTKLIINRTLKQLQDEAWLVPMRYFVGSIPDLTEANEHLERGDYAEAEAHNAMKLAPIVESYLEHANGKQGICFAVNVEHSKDIVKKYKAAGIDAVHLDAKTPDEDYIDKETGLQTWGRKSIVSRFKQGLIKVVVNVGILTEGTDFPNCEFIQLGRPTKSLSLFLQMVGRGTRAEKGLVDQYDSIEMRAFAIACSSKPYCIVLDNAGAWLEHGMPHDEIDWQLHFEGCKKQKKKKASGELEMLVWIAEDDSGRRVRTFNAHEVVGMRLIEVTKATRGKVANLKSIAAFDQALALFKNVQQVKKPGYIAFKKYFEHCQKQQILMVPEVWDYIREKLIMEPQRIIHERELAQQEGRTNVAPDVFERELSKIRKIMVSERWLIVERDKYTRANSAALMDYNYGLQDAATV